MSTRSTRPRPEDVVVLKLFFVGIATNVCVESTLRDAYFNEYWSILVTDAAMQAGPPAAREAGHCAQSS